MFSLARWLGIWGGDRIKMDIKLLDDLMFIMDDKGYEQEKLLAYVEDTYVDSPSSNFIYNEEKDIFDKVDTNVYEDYPLNSDNVSLLLSLKDMIREEIIEFLSSIVTGLEECV